MRWQYFLSITLHIPQKYLQLMWPRKKSLRELLKISFTKTRMSYPVLCVGYTGRSGANFFLYVFCTVCRCGAYSRCLFKNVISISLLRFLIMLVRRYKSKISKIPMHIHLHDNLYQSKTWFHDILTSNYPNSCKKAWKHRWNECSWYLRLQIQGQNFKKWQILCNTEITLVRIIEILKQFL